MAIGVLHLLSYVAAGGAFLFVLLSLGASLRFPATRGADLNRGWDDSERAAVRGRGDRGALWDSQGRWPARHLRPSSRSARTLSLSLLVTEPPRAFRPTAGDPGPPRPPAPRRRAPTLTHAPRARLARRVPPKLQPGLAVHLAPEPGLPPLLRPRHPRPLCRVQPL